MWLFAMRRADRYGELRIPRIVNGAELRCVTGIAGDEIEVLVFGEGLRFGKPGITGRDDDGDTAAYEQIDLDADRRLADRVPAWIRHIAGADIYAVDDNFTTATPVPDTKENQS